MCPIWFWWQPCSPHVFVNNPRAEIQLKWAKGFTNHSAYSFWRTYATKIVEVSEFLVSTIRWYVCVFSVFLLWSRKCFDTLEQISVFLVYSKLKSKGFPQRPMQCDAMLVWLTSSDNISKSDTTALPSWSTISECKWSTCRRVANHEINIFIFAVTW